MAIDITNRNPSDPNGVASISSNQTPAWISDDWGTLTLDQSEGQAKKLREVRVVRVTTNDGREFRAVLDGQGQPISVIGDQTGINTDQQSAFRQQTSTTKAPNGQQYSRGPDGTINEWNPNSNPPGYNIPHPEMSPAGTVYTPEQRQAQGSQAQIDASKAAEATRVANESSWNADPANAAAGGSGRYETHADRDARLAKEKIDADARARTQTIDAQNAATAAAASRRADSAEARAVAEANKVGSKVEDLPINGEHYTRITKTSADGKSTTIETYGPDGNLFTGALPREGATKLPPGMPPLDTSTPEKATASYLAQVRWSQQQIAAGGMTKQEAIDLLNPSHAAAQAVTDQAQTAIDNAQKARETANREQSTAVTQEGNRLQTATSQFANAEKSAANAQEVGPVGGHQSSNIMLGNILLQQLMNHQTSGTAGAIAPTAGVPPTSPLTTPGTAVGGPNALGLGALPSSITPTGVAAVDNIAAQAAAAPATIANTPGAGAMLATNEANRQLDLRTNGMAPTPQIVPGTPTAPAPLPPGVTLSPDLVRPTPPLGQGQDISTPAPGGINPPVGQPGNDPTKPVGMSLDQMPASVRHLYGRALIQQIMGGQVA